MYLNCHTYFSLKYGTLSVKELVEQAVERRLESLVLTDINTTSGCIEFARLCEKAGINPIVGVDFRNGNQQEYIVIAQNNEGFRELNEFLTKHHHNHEPFPPTAPEFNRCLVIYPFPKIKSVKLRINEFIGVKPHEVNRIIVNNWPYKAERMVILQPVTFRDPEDFNTHCLLRAIDKNTLLSKLHPAEKAHPKEVMGSERQLVKQYIDFPRIVENTRRILEVCHIDFQLGKNKNKKIFTTSKKEDSQLLRKLAYDGLPYRYPNADQEIHNRLEKELRMIDELDFNSYFLINWDITRYARDRNFFYVGRGSGANSIVAYCMRITNVDPVDLDLYFERFINPHRTSPPDFDIDFSWKDRDEMTDYIFKRYGNTHTALLATYNTFQSKAVIRELGKVFGLPKEEIDELSAYRKESFMPDQIAANIYRHSERIHDFPNHLSVHAGGILISEEPISQYTATFMPPKGFPTTEFSMLEAEDVGLYKFDILSQRGLGHIKDAVEIVQKNRNGIKIDIDNVREFKKDPIIKKMLSTGKTMGCFYVESPAMRMLLRKLKTTTYEGLVAASSIIRPGVARSGMMKAYIERHRDPGNIHHLHPLIGEILYDSYGVMIYQEDVIKIAHLFAGLTLVEADVLRRGMSGKFRSREEFLKVKDKFINNCIERGYGEGTTKEVWRQVESFAGYSFAKGHSASYSVESYQSMYLKAHFPLEFMVAVINNYGGFYRTQDYVHEARKAGADIQLPCVNNSDYLTTIQKSTIYLGLGLVREVTTKTVKMIVYARRQQSFEGLHDFIKRTGVPLEQIILLIRIGALRFTGKNKKELLWNAHLFFGKEKELKHEQELFDVKPRSYRLPALTYRQNEDAFDQMELLGFSLTSPFQLLKEQPKKFLKQAEFERHKGQVVSITGYLIHIKRTITVKKETMSFGTFIDVAGDYFDTTHFPPELKQYPFRGYGMYAITGKVVEDFGHFSLETISMKKLPVIEDPRYY